MRGNRFTDYPDMHLRFPDLKQIVENASQHGRWHDRLRAVQAVYLILDEQTGQQYIGSATGHDGLLGRWSDYAKTDGHGNNKEFIELLRKRPDAASDLSFSILCVFDRRGRCVIRC